MYEMDSTDDEIDKLDALYDDTLQARKLSLDEAIGILKKLSREYSRQIAARDVEYRAPIALVNKARDEKASLLIKQLDKLLDAFKHMDKDEMNREYGHELVGLKADVLIVVEKLAKEETGDLLERQLEKVSVAFRRPC